MFDVFVCFFFKQKTAYEMLISDWSSDVCSSDLRQRPLPGDKRIGNENRLRLCENPEYQPGRRKRFLKSFCNRFICLSDQRINGKTDGNRRSRWEANRIRRKRVG